MSPLRAKELIFTGDRITAQQAVEFELANRIVAHDDLISDARKLADKLIAQPRYALRESKKLMKLNLYRSAPQMLDNQNSQQPVATLSAECYTLATAFLDKQKRRQDG